MFGKQNDIFRFLKTQQSSTGELWRLNAKIHRKVKNWEVTMLIIQHKRYDTDACNNVLLL